jgi:hypothetical protein
MSMFELSQELGEGMWLTREQIEKLSKALEETPGSDLIFVKDVPNGSGIGPDTWGYIYKQKNMFQKPTLSAEVNLTDVSLW